MRLRAGCRLPADGHGVRQAGRLGVNILAGGQDDIALRFARSDLPDRFKNLDWRLDHDLPRIDGTVAWLRCEQMELVPGGDHTVVLAHVDEAAVTGSASLTYHLRSFHDLGPAAG